MIVEEPVIFSGVQRDKLSRVENFHFALQTFLLVP